MFNENYAVAAIGTYNKTNIVYCVNIRNTLYVFKFSFVQSVEIIMWSVGTVVIYYLKLVKNIVFVVGCIQG